MLMNMYTLIRRELWRSVLITEKPARDEVAVLLDKLLHLYLVLLKVRYSQARITVLRV